MKTLYKTRPAKNLSKIEGKFFVFDVETDGLQATPDKFIFGCMVGKDYRKIFYSVDEFKEEIKKKIFRHKYIFAHNAEFDLSVIYGNIKKNLDRKAIFNGSFILAKQGLTYFADSYKVLPTSVKAIGKAIGLEKQELESEYKEGKVKKITGKMIDYCYRDCDIVYIALLKMFKAVGSLKPTLAGLALQMFRNHYQPFHIVYDEVKGNKFFESYYGGRVECFKLGKTNSKKYDINSMYPFAMLNCTFPNPAYLKISKCVSLKKLKYYLKYFEGCAKVKIRHKILMFGFLPVKKDNKLIFPAGIYSGYYNFNELRFALSTGSIEIIECSEVVYSQAMQSPFKDYVIDLYEKKKAGVGIDALIYKLLLNTLYGKFAQKDKFEEIYFEDLPLDKILQLDEKKIKYEILHFNSQRKDGYLKIPIRNKNRFHTIPLFSSYITSFSRVHLLKSMLKFQKNKITYLDTDCISLENEIINFQNSSELGDFKLEDDEIIEIYGNKSYKYRKDEKEGKKLKGVPKGATEINDKEFNFIKLIKTKESIRRNLISGTPVNMTKKLKFNYDKRQIRESGNTKILWLSE